MKQDYSTELKELKEIYERTLEDIAPKYEQSFRQLIQMMKRFLEINDTRWSCEKKLEVLAVKLRHENGMDQEDWDSFDSDSDE